MPFPPSGDLHDPETELTSPVCPTLQWDSLPSEPYTSRQKHTSKRYMNLCVHSSIFTVARTWKQCKCPLTDEWTKKMRQYTHWNTLSYKKERNNAICSGMDGPRGIMGFSAWLMGKESTCSAGAVDLIPALRRSPGDSLHFSCLRHPMDRAWRAIVHRAGPKRLSMSMGL